MTYRTKILIIKENLRMQNYDGQFKLNGQEYFYRAKDDSGSSKITRVNLSVSDEYYDKKYEDKDEYYRRTGKDRRRV